MPNFSIHKPNTMKKNQSVNEFSLFTSVPKNRTTKNIVFVSVATSEICSKEGISCDIHIYDIRYKISTSVMFTCVCTWIMIRDSLFM